MPFIVFTSIPILCDFYHYLILNNPISILLFDVGNIKLGVVILNL